MASDAGTKYDEGEFSLWLKIFVFRGKLATNYMRRRTWAGRKQPCSAWAVEKLTSLSETVGG
jgi:hypothetical protein